MGISIPQLLIVLAILILLFGTKRLRNIGGDLGNAVKGFRKAMNTEDETADKPQEPQQLKGEDARFQAEESKAGESAKTEQEKK